MDDDIVARLNEQAKAPALVWLADAADEIERLRSAGDAMYSTISDIPIQRFDSGLGVINAMLNWSAQRKWGTNDAHL